MALGIESVNRVVNEKKIDGVYGTLITNFECNEKFFTAVEVTAGGKYVLFQILWVLSVAGLVLSHPLDKYGQSETIFCLHRQ